MHPDLASIAGSVSVTKVAAPSTFEHRQPPFVPAMRTSLIEIPLNRCVLFPPRNSPAYSAAPALTLRKVKLEKSATGPCGSETQQYSAFTEKAKAGRPGAVREERHGQPAGAGGGRGVHAVRRVRDARHEGARRQPHLLTLHRSPRDRVRLAAQPSAPHRGILLARADVIYSESGVVRRGVAVEM